MNPVPDNWEMSSLGAIANDISYGFTTTSNISGNGAKLLRITDIQEGRVNWSTVPHCTDLPRATYLLRPEDIVIARTGATTGKSYLIEELSGDVVYASYLIRLRVNDLIEPKYLWSFLQSNDYWSQIQMVSKGTAQPGANATILSQVRVPIAPRREQRRVVAKIDSLSAKSGRARDHLDHLSRLVEKYKQAVLAAAFGGDLTREWRKRAGIVDGVPIEAEIELPYRQVFAAPSSWMLRSFSEVCEIQGGSQPPKSTFEYKAAAHLIRLVQIRDYKSDDHVTYIPRELARRFCSTDDIMIGRYGPPIFQILRGIAGAYNVALMKAVPVDTLIGREFLFWYLNFPHLRSFVEFKSERTAGQDGVNKDHLLRWPVLLPPLNEQVEIVQRIESALNWIDRLASEATNARRLVDHLDQAVLAKAFRGELVPQDTSDEPASVLLERIRAERALPFRSAGARGGPRRTA
jgi:type I restriction enzyme, S subunit